VALARTFGLEPEIFLEAIAGSASDSPYAHLKSAVILEGNRTPQFALDGLLKDLRLAQATAGSSMTTTYLDGLERLYAEASEEGHGHEDVAWVYDAINAPIPTR
jgi:3-hydroxyisobutyrate dehydrogenase